MNRFSGFRVAFIAACCVGFLTLPHGLVAQTAQGTILGHVTDASGSPVVGATVTIHNLATNISQHTDTSDVGDYVFVNVQPGRYEITAESKGFRTSQTQVTLDVEHTLRQNFSLSVGEVLQRVEVTSEAQMVQSDDATIGNVITGKEIEELPIAGRDFTNLLRIQAGATTTGGGVSWAWTMHGLNDDWLATSINGARSESTSYLVDGINSNDQFFAAQSGLPSSFSVAEFKVQNGMYSAEYGQGSAQVNIAIKSGTNQYHGQGYDFLQNDIFQPESPLNRFLNATQPGPVPLPLKNILRQNQFGFTLGGPLQIPKVYNGANKTFWFFGYDVGLKRQEATSRFNVPTAQERTGNFSDWPYQLYDPSTTGEAPVTAQNPAGRLPFPGNQIPSGDFNPIALNILKYIPTANVPCPNPCPSSTGNYQATVPKPWDTYMTTMRGDQNIGDNNRIFFTGILANQQFLNQSAMPLSGEGKFTWQQLFGLNWQHTFSPNIFNEARVGYTFQKFQDASQTSFGPNIAAQEGFQNEPNVPAFFGPVITNFNGYQTLGNSNSAWTQQAQTFQYMDDLKIIHGHHTLTMGADVRQMIVNLIDGYGGLMGQVNFTGAYTASNPALAGSGYGPGLGNAFADFLLGFPQSVSSPSTVPTDHYDVRGINWNFYIQDDIRVTPRLTLNLGLRYELPPAFHSINNSGIALDTSAGGGYLWANPGFVNAALQTPGVNPNLLRCCVDSKLIEPDRKDFAPRFGFAWRPFASDRFVIRGGYGMFYDIYARYYELTTFDDDYLYAAPSVSYQPGSGFEKASPLPLNTLWKPFPSGTTNYSLFTLPFWNLGLQINWPGNRQPRTQQWSFGFQYALTQNLLLDASYVGSHAQHENGYWYFNSGYLPKVAGDPCNVWITVAQAQSQQPSCLSDPNFQPVAARDPYPNLDPLSYANANVFWSNYESGQLRLTQRLSSGLQYQVNYTYSKMLDVLSEIGLLYGVTSFVQDPHNLRGDYGPASFDQPQRLSALGSYEVPVGRGKKWEVPHLNWLLGGWEVSGTYTLASGMPYTISAFNGGTDQIGLNRPNDIRPDVVGNPYSGTTSIYQQFNPAAFVAPPQGRFGNLGHNTMRTPFYGDTDMAFGKNIYITERNVLKYKLEIFNLGSTWHSNTNLLYPDNRLQDSPVGCTSGPSGNCAFSSLVPLNGAGSLNLWNPRRIQMSLVYQF
ncbi:MAG: TonB-dependent receptor [Acidobacteriaceae bacterium]|nr:TonB-dependent receptor [Acidobacteriaceae bacterium]MBV9780911.1 TonB-dependent receptor [Acidobacteriaceae bacterium]